MIAHKTRHVHPSISAPSTTTHFLQPLLTKYTMLPPPRVLACRPHLTLQVIGQIPFSHKTLMLDCQLLISPTPLSPLTTMVTLQFFLLNVSSIY